MKMMDTTLKGLLRNLGNHRVTNNNNKHYSHTCMFGCTGKYSIQPDDYDRFYKVYCKIFEGENPKDVVSGITELAKLPERPLIVDIDIQTPEDELQGREGLYKEEHINELVQVYFEVLEKYLDFDSTKKCAANLVCVVLEKPMYYVEEKKIYKNGFHLHFPGIWLITDDMDKYLTPRILHEVNERNIFGRHGLNHKAEEVLDVSINHSPWLMYGSRKAAHLDPYIVTKVLGPDLEPVDPNIFRMLTMTRPQAQKSWWSPKRNINFYWPIILSLNGFGRQDKTFFVLKEQEIVNFKGYEYYHNLCYRGNRRYVRENINPNIGEDLSDEDDDGLIKFKDLHAPQGKLTWEVEEDTVLNDNDNDNETEEEFTNSTLNPEGYKRDLSLIQDTNYTFDNCPVVAGHMNDDDIEEVVNLVSILSKDRAVTYHPWITIGLILHSIFEGALGGLQLWAVFSRQHPEKYDYTRMRIVYENFKILPRGKGYTIGTLKYFAKQDNPDLYNTLCKKKQNHWVNTFMKFKSQNDLAKMLYEKHGHGFRCAKLRGNVWYQFVNNAWRRDEEGISLRRLVTDDLGKTFRDQLEEIKETATFEELEKRGIQFKSYEKNIANLGSANYKDQVMKEAREVFYENNFAGKLDQNPYLFGFRNGVYDLKAHQFRSTTPDDYIHKLAGVDYKHFSPSSKEMKDLDLYFEQIFPDPLIKKYFLDVYCRIFVGNNADKLFVVWTGDGDNGKSITTKMFEEMLGEYSADLPTSLITQKRTNSSAAAPELARIEGVRMCWLKEPSPDEHVNVGIMKELTGGDTFFARNLYDEGHDVKSMFKLAFVCNKPPKIINDQSAWNRIRLLPFESVFCDDAPDSVEQQKHTKRFKIDRKFDQKISKLIQALPSYLLQYYKMFGDKSIKEPEKVKQATLNYKRKNDYIEHFFLENIVDDHSTPTDSDSPPPPPDQPSFVSLNDIYGRFKEWIADAFATNQNLKKISKFDLKDELVRFMGTPSPTKNIYKFFKLR